MLYKGFKQDIIACIGEFFGTTMFLFLGLGCIKTAQDSVTQAQTETATALSQQTIMFISVGMGLSLLITAWVFYRITGGLFNPCVTLALWLIGGLTSIRAILLTIAQLGGGIAGAALVAGLTPTNAGGASFGVSNTVTTLSEGMTLAKGIFLEAFLTAMLVFTVLMLAAEKHKATFLAPIGIGLTLFVCQLLGTLWTGCAMNPARALGPSVISGRWPGYHWIYYVGPYIGSLIATLIYSILKSLDYTSVVLGQDSSDEDTSPRLPIATRAWHASMGFTRDQRKAMLASGMRPEDLEAHEAGMVATAQNPMHTGVPSTTSRNSDATLNPAYGAPQHPNIHMNANHGPVMFPKGDVNNGMAGQHSSPLASTYQQPPMMMTQTHGSRPSGGARTNSTLMQADNQATGGMGAPGQHKTGLSAIKGIRNTVMR